MSIVEMKVPTIGESVTEVTLSEWLKKDGDYVELPDEAEDGPDLLRVRIDAGQARRFVPPAEALVSSGRPTCPFCGQPLDPSGHFCSRGNGQLN